MESITLPFASSPAIDWGDFITHFFSQLYSSDCSSLSYIFLLERIFSSFHHPLKMNVMENAKWLVLCVLLEENMREYMEERTHRIVERKSWREFPLARKTGRNWGPLGGHTLSALVPFTLVIFSQLSSFFGLITQV
jgi:hypothetical protein